QLSDAPDVIGRIQAANELCKTGKAANIRAVGEAYKKERFWGVRCDMATALGKAKSEAALEVCLEIAAEENDPMVLATSLRALGNFRDFRVRELLEKRLEAGLPPLAAAAAYEGLGAQRENAPLKLLTKAAKTKSLHFFAHAGAMRGLAATRDKSAGDTLKALTPHGAGPLRSRAASFDALAGWGRNLSQRKKAQYRETLEDILRDPMERMRLRAAGALGSLGDPAAVAAVSALLPNVPQQSRVSLEETIKGLRKSGDGSDASKLEKRVEELEDERRKLEDRLRKLEEKLG
ncbi:MAG: HEAT repeat domain-containing protein, partial [Planctomycetes bacterium]|nr:HEAT repeat domain-containing protein [Planctomycetota bacterium]